jgi:hypothetical protein
MMEGFLNNFENYLIKFYLMLLVVENEQLLKQMML